MTTISLIIARHKEDVSWSDRFVNNRLVYNKGPDVDYSSIALPNVGNEGNTYLEHIIRNYNNLDDYSVFVQGSIYDDHVDQDNVKIDDINYVMQSADLLSNMNVKYIGLNTSKRQKQRWDGWNSFLNFDDPCHMYDGKHTLQTCLRSLYEKYPNNIRIKNGNITCNYCGFF